MADQCVLMSARDKSGFVGKTRKNTKSRAQEYEDGKRTRSREQQNIPKVLRFSMDINSDVEG